METPPAYRQACQPACLLANAILSALLILGAGLLPAAAQEIAPADRPNRAQRLLMERGYGMFVHFGVNTFTGDEWSDGTTPPATYNPTGLDCDQWVRVARDAGFRYVLLVTKHHDGFCLWDSKHTDYDVASSPVATDVVGEVSRACRKYGLQFGIYYSLWDRHEPSYRDADPMKYVDYMEKQLTELLTGYGPVCELWFDGGWDRAVEDWHLPEVYRMVKALQPDCAVGVNHTIVDAPGSRRTVLPDLMLGDNRHYMQYFPSDFRLWDPKVAHRDDHKQYLYAGQSYYLPFEHTVCLSKAWTWFQKAELQPVRDLDELQELFYRCTANGNTLVLNVPPAPDGKIREHEANAAIELGRRLGLRRGKPLPQEGKVISYGKTAAATSVYGGDHARYGAQQAVDGGMQTRWAAADTLAELVVNLDAREEFDKVSIFEYCDAEAGSDGFSNVRHNRIRAYRIDIMQGGTWQTIYASDEPMGDCKVIRLPRRYATPQIRLKVLKATAPPSIYEFDVIDHHSRKIRL